MTMKQFFLTLVFFSLLFSVALSVNAQPITWKSTNGPDGGAYGNGVILLPNGDLLAGYFLSTDRGDHWQQVIHPARREIIVVHTSDRLGRLYGQSIDVDTTIYTDLIRSDDLGKTWFRQSVGLKKFDIITIILGRDNELYAFGINGDVLQSTDRGDNWLQVSKLPSSYFNGGIVAIDSGGTYYVSDGSGSLYRSTDNCKTWKNISTAIHSFAIATDKNGNVYVLGRGASLTSTFVSRSSDLGLTWKDVPVPESFSGSMDVVTGSHNDVYIFHGPNSDSSQAFTCRSTDGGMTWNTILPGLDSIPFPDGTGAVIDPDGRLYISIEGAGIWRSLDGGIHWASSNYGMTNNIVRQGVVTNSGTLVTEGYYDVIHKYKNGSWQYPSHMYHGSKFSFEAALIKSASGDVLSCASGSGIYRSSDDGSNWTQLSDFFGIDTLSPLPYFLITHIYATRLCADSSGIIYAGASRDLNYNGQARGKGVYISADDGISWKKAWPPLADSTILSIAAGKDGSVYAGTPSGIFRTTDHAQTWSQLQGLPSGYRTNSVAVAPSGSIYVGDSVLIYRSDDKGISWTSLAPVYPLSGISQIFITPKNEIFAIVDSVQGLFDFPYKKIFFSKDAGKSWTDITQGLQPNYITSDNKGKYYLCTEGQGVYEYTMPNSVSSSSVPSEYSVSITPNPAGNRGVLNITSSKRERLTVKLYDSKGAEVLRLYDGISPSTIKKHIDLSGLLPGSYELQAVHDGRTFIQKLVIIR